MSEITEADTRHVKHQLSVSAYKATQSMEVNELSVCKPSMYNIPTQSSNPRNIDAISILDSICPPLSIPWTIYASAFTDFFQNLLYWSSLVCSQSLSPCMVICHWVLVVARELPTRVIKGTLQYRETSTVADNSGEGSHYEVASVNLEGESKDWVEWNTS